LQLLAQRQLNCTPQNELFQNVFEVSAVDAQGKKFDKVSRITATSDNIDMEVVLDIHSDISPLLLGDKFTLLLASSLMLGPAGGASNSATSGQQEKEAWRLVGKQATLADEYDYVMHGKVYKYDDAGAGRAALYVSFGGLLMCLAGDYRQLQEFSVGQSLYLLLRK
jgi:DNA-directed RNA polymerases I, II, and III subunit RPABC3